jgi:hypothetical protein
VHVGDHFYTTDFYQVSAFNHKDQIISIYYLVHTSATNSIQTKEKAFDFLPEEVADSNGTAEHLRWIPLSELKEESMSLPIDKVVIKMLVDLFAK